ncbi:coiled-coil domain-containing protein [Actinomadura kijaniata]|uniref:coiled-coil domain-containing protein n=1 Tax=Actinomadura kijaniata TaxID=46161 RepID=UPI003F1B234A
MAALDPSGSVRRFPRARPIRRGGAALALVLAGTALFPAATAAGAPTAPKKDPKKEYAELKRRADRLSKEYRGELITLDQAKKAAERAGTDAERLTAEYERSRGDVSRMAATSYMTGSIDTIPLITADEPRAAVRDAAVVEHLARNNGRRIESLRVLADQARRSQEDAQAKLAAVRKEIEDLESQRDRVRKLLKKYKPEAAPKKGGGGTSGRPDGASGTKSPIIGNSMTPRMRTVLMEVDGKFGPFPAVGCARPGDPQDHGSGRACDFMESTAGRMPSASATAHGNAVSQYLISNASRLGLKYIIWRQRIYDFRGSGGWRQMENRGSVTQNHFDHVHVSVL